MAVSSLPSKYEIRADPEYLVLGLTAAVFFLVVLRATQHHAECSSAHTPGRDRLERQSSSRGAFLTVLTGGEGLWHRRGEFCS
jgi:hypothetical protein